MTRGDYLARVRFNFDLQYRRQGPKHQLAPNKGDWPAEWRARFLPTKNERAEYRLEAYADTPDGAWEALQAMVHQVDTGTK
jgi:hypothetical protein